VLVDSAGQPMEGTARLAQEGEEWLPGRDYELLEKIGGAGAGDAAEGTESIVFKIRLLRPPRDTYALKQVVLLDRRGEFQDDASLNAKLGKEWRVALSLPPHECIVPVLHHYNSSEPSLKDPQWGLPVIPGVPEMHDAAAERTLFVVMPLYQTSLRAWVSEQLDTGLAPPYGKTWQWWGKLLTRLLRAVDHLIRHGAVHGDLKEDQCFLCDGFELTAEVVVGDLGEAWRTVNADGSDRLLQESDYDKRAGVGVYKAPELRPGRRDHPLGTPLSEVFSLAESFTVGVMMYGLLDCFSEDKTDVFHRAAGIGPSPPLPGCTWDDAEMPPLPASCPTWLAEVIQGLARSPARATATAAAPARLSAAQAIDMLGVEQVARTMGQLEESRAATEAVRQQLQREQQELEELRKQAEQAAQSALVQEREATAARRREAERTREIGVTAEKVAEERRRWEAAKAAMSAAAAAEVAEKQAEVQALHAKIARMEEAQARETSTVSSSGGVAVAATLLESVQTTGAQLFGAARQHWQHNGDCVSPPVVAGCDEGGVGVAELEEVISWAKFEMLGGRQHLLLAYTTGGVQLWDVDDDPQAGRHLRGGAPELDTSASDASSTGGIAGRLVFSRRKVGEPGDVVRCGVCLDPASVAASSDAGSAGRGLNNTVLLALSMNLGSAKNQDGVSNAGGMIRFLPVPGVGELPPLQTSSPVDAILANGDVIVALMTGGGSARLLQVWTRHSPDSRHPNPVGLLTQSIEMVGPYLAAPFSTSDDQSATKNAPVAALGTSWLAFAALPPEAIDEGSRCPESLCVMDEPVFVTTTTTQAVEVADATVGYIDGATRWLASNAAATIAPHISTLVVNNGEGSATSDSEANAAAQVEPSQQSESEPQPEPEQVAPPFVGQPSGSGWVAVRHAIDKTWVAHFRAATTPVVALQLSPSSRLLACVANGGRDIELWRLQSGAQLKRSTGGTAAAAAAAVCVGHMSRGSWPSTVVDLSFSADERHLVVCSGAKGTVHVFALRAVMAARGQRHTAHAKVSLPSWLGSLGSWAANIGGPAGPAETIVTPLCAVFTPPPSHAAVDSTHLRPARVLILSPPGQLRLVELHPAKGIHRSDDITSEETSESVMNVAFLRNDDAVGRRRLDPDISTAPTTLAATLPTELAAAVAERELYASCLRPLHAPRTSLWKMPGIRTGPADRPPEAWVGLGGREWVGGVVEQQPNMHQAGDGDQLVDLAEEGLGDGMGFVAIDDHFAVPLPAVESD
jgi:serine/threonine protein kinase